MLKNKIRIIGGEWRSRQISFYDLPGLRPTPNRLRETLFNWLQHEIPGSRCLDLFAGSGALGFEAASRGATEVVQVENNAQACRALKENAVKLDARRLSIIQNDVFRYLAGNSELFDIVFLDPPFDLNIAGQACQWLEDKDWLSAQAKIYVETENGQRLENELPKNWRLLKEKSAGEVTCRLYSKG